MSNNNILYMLPNFKYLQRLIRYCYRIKTTNYRIYNIFDAMKFGNKKGGGELFLVPRNKKKILVVNLFFDFFCLKTNFNIFR